MSVYAVTTVDTVVEAKALQPKPSAQKAALIALTRVLEQSEGMYGLIPGLHLEYYIT